ncbi:MAG: hypothetical protein QOE45_624 [Frankiaceae bacterium]|jgi:hypothetical protein|nr:hypothetical protein [Frankiaceae bacterium]
MRRRTAGIVVAATVLAAAGAAGGAGAAPPLRFRVVDVPNSAGATEPSLVIDSKGRIFVSAIFGLPGDVSAPGTPVWRSVNGGVTFTRHSTASAGPVATPLSGGDSALMTDKRDTLYATDLWVGNDSIAFSTDHADSWTGSPASHRMVGDRNWLAYATKDDALYQIWNGVDALYVARADLGTPAGSLAALSFANNYRVAGEMVGVPGSYTRADSVWPGGIAVDQREGAVFATWSDQDGLAVARSADKGATWTIGHIPGTRVNGSWNDTGWNYAPVGVDARGNVFVAYSQLTGSAASPSRISTYVAVSRDNGRTWRKTRIATRTTSVFPTLAVLGVDRVAVSWIDAAEYGNPNNPADFNDVDWRLAYAEVKGLAAGRPSTLSATVEGLVHTGTVFVGTQGGNRGMGDFFSMAAGPDGRVAIAYSRAVGGKSQPRVATLAPRR